MTRAQLFRTKIHVAGEPIGGVQRCARCGCELENATGARGEYAVINSHAKDYSFPFWSVGGYIGVVEASDGRPLNPTTKILMGRDAREMDEISCSLSNLPN